MVAAFKEENVLFSSECAEYVGGCGHGLFLVLGFVRGFFCEFFCFDDGVAYLCAVFAEEFCFFSEELVFPRVEVGEVFDASFVRDGWLFVGIADSDDCLWLDVVGNVECSFEYCFVECADPAAAEALFCCGNEHVLYDCAGLLECVKFFSSFSVEAFGFAWFYTDDDVYGGVVHPVLLIARFRDLLPCFFVEDKNEFPVLKVARAWRASSCFNNVADFFFFYRNVKVLADASAFFDAFKRVHDVILGREIYKGLSFMACRVDSASVSECTIILYIGMFWKTV